MPISGQEAIKILQKHGYSISRQKGSHVIVSKQVDGSKKVAVVPNHKELKKGTLRSIARQANIDKSELGV